MFISHWLLFFSKSFMTNLLVDTLFVNITVISRILIICLFMMYMVLNLFFFFLICLNAKISFSFFIFKEQRNSYRKYRSTTRLMKFFRTYISRTVLALRETVLYHTSLAMLKFSYFHVGWRREKP